MHNAYKVGKYWNNISDCKEKAICLKYGMKELLEHILTECKVSGQVPVWNLAKVLLEKKDLTYNKLSLRDILDCAISLEEGKSVRTPERNNTGQL